jgi:hypothetical protein
VECYLVVWFLILDDFVQNEERWIPIQASPVVVRECFEVREEKRREEKRRGEVAGTKNTSDMSCGAGITKEVF